MNITQKKRILNLIDDLRQFTFYHPGDYPDKAEASLFDLQGKLEMLKIYTMRVDNEFIKSQISELFTEFDLSDQGIAMKQFNKSKALFEEIEDYVLQENYEAISGFNENTNENRLFINDDKRRNINIDKKKIKTIQKQISIGELNEAIENLIILMEVMDLSNDNLIISQNRLSNIKAEYNRGVIEFKEFLRLNTSIVVLVITELNKIKRCSSNNALLTD